MRRSRLHGAVFVLLAVTAPVVGTEDRADAGREVVRIKHGPLAEISGAARSATYDDVFWLHNDHGDEARLFAVDSRGRVIIPGFLADKYHGETEQKDKEEWPGVAIVGAFNIDWEDIALADGRLYIADMGNNGNARRDLGVYVVNEPNPHQTTRVRLLKHLPVTYPEQTRYPGKLWHYDCEAMFVSEGKLYFLTKHRKTGEIRGWKSGTVLYRLDSRHTDRENPLTRVGSDDRIMLATAADVSPSGSKLAVLTYFTLWIFDKPAEGDNWLAGRPSKLDLPGSAFRQNEAVTWADEETLVVLSESRHMMRVRVADLKPLTP
jgi:hypothetical protein